MPVNYGLNSLEGSIIKPASFHVAYYQGKNASYVLHNIPNSFYYILIIAVFNLHCV